MGVCWRSACRNRLERKWNNCQAYLKEKCWSTVEGRGYDERPTSNPLPPQSAAFASHKKGQSLSEQRMLDNVAQQIPNFGTEQDMKYIVTMQNILPAVTIQVKTASRNKIGFFPRAIINLKWNLVLKIMKGIRSTKSTMSKGNQKIITNQNLMNKMARNIDHLIGILMILMIIETEIYQLAQLAISLFPFSIENKTS